MVFDNKNMISVECTWIFLSGTVNQKCDQVLVNLQLLYAELEGFTDTILPAWRYIHCCRWLSRCRVTNYINHPPEICEDVFVMMQLLATMATANSFYSNALFQTQFHVLLLCRGEICLEQFLQLRLNKTHVQFLPPAALETTHTCSRSSRQSIHFLFRDLNNIENNK